MNRYLLVSCLAATFLMAGAAATPSSANDTDMILAGQADAWNVRAVQNGAGTLVAQQEEGGQEEGASPESDSPSGSDSD